MLPPFRPPDDPARFFEWLWEELFDEERWRLDDPAAYEVDSDVEEANAKLAPPLR